MKRMISIGLLIVGGLLIVVALVSGGASILSLLERVQHEQGLFFADVQFFAFMALIATILGVALLFVAKKLSNSLKR